MAVSKTYRCRALVLKKTKLSETDLILTLLSERGCRLRAVARGARKANGRIAGKCDYFCEADLLLAKGKNLDVVSEVALISNHGGIKEDLDKTASAFIITEVAEKCAQEGYEDPWLFAISSKALRLLETVPDAAHGELLAAAYTLKVFSHLGWQPELSRCVGCGEDLCSSNDRPEEKLWFSPGAGGLVCGSCVGELSDATMVSCNLAGWLHACIQCSFDTLLESPLDPKQARSLLEISGIWAQTYLECSLPSFDFISSGAFML